MPISAEDFHQAWANQAMRAQKAELDLEAARKKIAELEQENLKLKTAVENCFRPAGKKENWKNVSSKT